MKIYDIVEGVIVTVHEIDKVPDRSTVNVGIQQTNLDDHQLGMLQYLRGPCQSLNLIALKIKLNEIWDLLVDIYQRVKRHNLAINFSRCVAADMTAQGRANKILI